MVKQDDRNVGAVGAVEGLTKLLAQQQADHVAALAQARQEATIETIADGMAPHPTLSEAIKGAGLVAC